MRFTLLITALLCFGLNISAQEATDSVAAVQQKMAHLNADVVVTSFPEWIKALEETAAIDQQQQQLLAQCAAEFEKVKDDFRAMDFTNYSAAQKDSVFKVNVFSKGQECEKIRGGLLQNSKDLIPEDVRLFQQVMDKVLVHFKAKDGYGNIYPMATMEIQKPEIQESIKYYKSTDITEAFIEVMKAHIAKSENLKVAALSEIGQ